jgi:hypothetical protein
MAVNFGEDLLNQLMGTWIGEVHTDMGGYVQRLEFSASGKVSTGIASLPAKMGEFSVNSDAVPYPTLEIKFPDISNFVVPYIFKFTEGPSLHLCCPFLDEKLPHSFEGPGYVIMRRPSSGVTQVSNERIEIRVKRYLKEAVEILLRVTTVEEVGSEVEANKAAISLISAYTKIDSLLHKFGPDVKEFLKAKKFAADSDIGKLYTLMKRLCADKSVPIEAEQEAEREAEQEAERKSALEAEPQRVIAHDHSVTRVLPVLFFVAVSVCGMFFR